MHSPYFPIIYVRGYAMSQSEIEDAVADPFMGFNLGSTHLRQRADRTPERYIFESPLVRLMKDHGYVDCFRHGSENFEPNSAPAKSIWIFRYYDNASKVIGDGQREEMEDLAILLREFILNVRLAVCGDDQARKEKFRVNLVAHSMGGLVCRAYLQNLCVYGSSQESQNKNLELMTPARADPHARTMVDKLFTYGTPHNGIELRGWNIGLFDFIDTMQLNNFNRKRMREFLKIRESKESEKAPVNHLDGQFPIQKVFCLVGSNHRDYNAAGGKARRIIGPLSDGLVMIENAWLRGSSRVIIHRSHSGPYGIVNSEAGYQNLRRFLFGARKVIALLHCQSLRLAPHHEYLRDLKNKEIAYPIESVITVRGATQFVLAERSIANESAELRSATKFVPDWLPADRKIKDASGHHKINAAYLFTGFLMEGPTNPLQIDVDPEFDLESNDKKYAIEDCVIHITIRNPIIQIGKQIVEDANETSGALFDETITIGIDKNGAYYGVRSRDGLGNKPHRIENLKQSSNPRTNEVMDTFRIPVGQQEHQFTSPGFSGFVEFQVLEWNEPEKIVPKIKSPAQSVDSPDSGFQEPNQGAA